MTFGEKLSKLRKENNTTQEQLADRLGVSRQAISKWESNAAFPETEKLIRISELFDCSLDYLLKDNVESAHGSENDGATKARSILSSPIFNIGIRERKSEKTWHGLPLWHIGKNAKGVLAIGLRAQGIVAIGLLSRGVVTLGLFTLGLFSLGLFSLGLFAFGAFALGGLSVGAISIGIVAIGAIALGVFSLGALSVGGCSAGALAIAKYIAIGDHAEAAIAIGNSKAVGSVYQKLGEMTSEEVETVKGLIDANLPSYLKWAGEWIKRIIEIVQS